MQKGWNRRPEPLLNIAWPIGGLPAVAGRTARRSATAAGAWWLANRGVAWLALRFIRAPHLASAANTMSVWGWYLLTAYLAVLAVDAAWAALQLARPKLNPAWADANLTEAQANLWGIPATAMSPAAKGSGQQRQQQAPRQQPPQQQGQQHSHLVTPLRPQRVPATPPSGGGVGHQQQQQQHTPPHQNGSAPGRSGQVHGSPYGGGPSPVVTTPEQLQRYLDALDADTSAPADGPDLGFGAFPFSSASATTPRASGFGASPFDQPQHPSQENRSPSSALKMGVSAPTYRPSVLPMRVGAGGGGGRARGKLAPSAPAAVAAALHHLVTDRRTLEVWTERFREWMAAHVLQPLVRLMSKAHQEVMDKTAAAGWPGIRLSELGDAEDAAAAVTTPVRPSPAASAAADEEMLVRQLREALRARAAAPPASAEVNAALQAVEVYQRLAALLAGEAPRGLLPPAPRGYVALRIRQLAESWEISPAEGTCVKEFNWNGGGAWQNRAWTPDLPTDAALLFYLFAAFLEAPRWLFNDEAAAAVVAGPPLFLGSLPARQPEQFYALLPFRPASLSKGATAVLALELGGREPHFTLVLAGEPLLTAASHTAPFHVLLLFLHAANTAHGAVGGRSLEYLRLASVLRPAGRVRDLFAGRWFGMWT